MPLFLLTDRTIGTMTRPGANLRGSKPRLEKENRPANPMPRISVWPSASRTARQVPFGARQARSRRQRTGRSPAHNFIHSGQRTSCPGCCRTRRVSGGSGSSARPRRARTEEQPRLLISPTSSSSHCVPRHQPIVNSIALVICRYSGRSSVVEQEVNQSVGPRQSSRLFRLRWPSGIGRTHIRGDDFECPRSALLDRASRLENREFARRSRLRLILK